MTFSCLTFFLVICVTVSGQPDISASSSWAKLQISPDTLVSMAYGNFRVDIYEHANNHKSTTTSISNFKYFYAPIALLDHQGATMQFLLKQRHEKGGNAFPHRNVERQSSESSRQLFGQSCGTSSERPSGASDPIRGRDPVQHVPVQHLLIGHRLEVIPAAQIRLVHFVVHRSKGLRSTSGQHAQQSTTIRSFETSIQVVADVENQRNGHPH